MFRALLVWCLLATPAAAQVELGEYPSFQTRFGMLQVQRQGEFEQVLTWNGQALPVGDYNLSIAGAWALPDIELDWVLIGAHHGGNMCPHSWFLARVDPLGISVSPRIDECAGRRVLDLRILADRIEIDIPHADIAIDQQTISYDGRSLTAHLADAMLGEGQAGQGDPRRWIGQHPIAALRDPDEQARFLTIMDEAAFRLMVRQIGGPGGPTFERQGWVLAGACMAHQCNTRAALWGVRLADGQAAAAILEAGGPYRKFGLSDDAVFLQFLAEIAF